MPEINKVLIANRGEIAIRIMRTCREMGIATVAVYSDADVAAPHTRYADESVRIGEASSSASYLRMDALFEAARLTGADAIHPGYGFLSENATFARRCEEKGFIFIGPPPSAIDRMGDKTKARELMSAAGVPLPPGTTSALESVDEARDIANQIGYPVLIKAAAGGGGKGMRLVYDSATFDDSVRSAQSEALSAFGDGRVYVEKFLEEPRHVEFQILADSHGNVLHLFDRECSIQRRHQKVVEEAPCAILDDAMRADMAHAAILAAKGCGYIGAGTIEFLVDKHRKFYFLEMNTRLQVEHPVTECITGLDLVRLQLEVAMGKALTIRQDDLKINGHAIECRICAEDSESDFLPSTGHLSVYQIPSGPGVRVDDGVQQGQDVSVYYDPLLAKLVVWAATREQAMDRMHRALSEYIVRGVDTTIPFCSFVMTHEAFRSARFDTSFVKQYWTNRPPDPSPDPTVFLAAALALHESSLKSTPSIASTTAHQESGWWHTRRTK
jgi:acetyl-CoA carboxylase biotin carboxylase subunit